MSFLVMETMLSPVLNSCLVHLLSFTLYHVFLIPSNAMSSVLKHTLAACLHGQNFAVQIICAVMLKTFFVNQLMDRFKMESHACDPNEIHLVTIKDHDPCVKVMEKQIYPSAHLSILQSHPSIRTFFHSSIHPSLILYLLLHLSLLTQ